MNTDRLGRGIVALILVVDGAHHAVTGKLWGRLRLAESIPVSEGWHIVFLGIVEAVAGLILAYNLIKNN